MSKKMFFFCAYKILLYHISLKRIKEDINMEDVTIKEQEIDKIIAHCKQKLDMSYFKYGPAGKNYGGGRVDALGTLDKCIIKFNRTKNTEYLEDAINYLLLRMLFPMPGDHYTSTDSSESAGIDGVPINME